MCAFCEGSEICYNARVKNYAFIDSQNLHKSMEAMGYKIDYRRFRLWLKNRHDVERAFMYFGYMEGREALYGYLRQCGFELIFRDVEYHLGRTKGNVDICLTISVLEMLEDFDRGYLVTSDGDFFDLTEKLKRKERFGGVISPQTSKRCSTLLRKSCAGNISFIPDVIHKFGNANK